MFELASADLAEIDVPTIRLTGGELPTQDDIRGLIDHVRANLASVGEADAEVTKRIRAELKQFDDFSGGSRVCPRTAATP